MHPITVHPEGIEDVVAAGVADVVVVAELVVLGVLETLELEL